MPYYVKNQRGTAVNISVDEYMKDFCIAESDINEHLRAQITHIRNGHKDHKIQSIVIGIPNEKFIETVQHLCTTYKGFIDSVYLRTGIISILLNSKGSEVIRIVNSDRLEINTD